MDRSVAAGTRTADYPHLSSSMADTSTTDTEL